MPRLSRSFLTAAATAALAGSVLLGGGAAWSAWSVSGLGAGASAAGSLVTPVVTATRSTTSPTSAVDLSWSAPGQLSGTTYSVTRNGTSIACTTSPCTDSGLAAGATYSYVVTASLGSSWSAASNTATASTQTAVLRPTTTSLTSSQNPARSSTTVIFTATVAPQSGTGVPSGTVSFKDNGVAISCTAGSQSLNGSGVATCQTSFPTFGAPHPITAVYGGDSTFATSTSSAVSQRVVNGAVTGLALTNIKINGNSASSGAISCTGIGTASYSCTVSGTNNNDQVTADVVFVNSSGNATVYATDATTGMSWTSNGKSPTNGTISILANASASTANTFSGIRQGVAQVTGSVVLNDAGQNYTASFTSKN